MLLTASSLRQGIYRFLISIAKGALRVPIEPEAPKAKLDQLKHRPYLRVAPEELVHIDWLGEWLRINLPLEEGERRYPMIRPLKAP